MTNEVIDLNELLPRIEEALNSLEYGFEYNEEELISVLHEAIEAMQVLYELYEMASSELEDRDVDNAMHLKNVAELTIH